MFTDPGRSQWDLNFRLLGIPIRVAPMFWLMALILGQSSLQLGIQFLLAWVVCVFLSILIHEMGHVVAARAFGVDGEIVLYGFGGLAIPAGQMRHRWQHILVCFAGPIAGFLFLAFVVLCLPAVAPELWAFLRNRFLSWLGREPDGPMVMPAEKLQIAIFSYLFWINLIWGLVNLLPIWPLDGGQISRDVFTMLIPRSGASIALGISLVLSGVLAANALLALNGSPFLPRWVPSGGFWSVLMYGYLVVGSYMALQEEQARRNWVDDRVQRWDPDEDDRRRW